MMNQSKEIDALAKEKTLVCNDFIRHRVHGEREREYVGLCLSAMRTAGGMATVYPGQQDQTWPTSYPIIILIGLLAWSSNVIVLW